MNRTFFFIIWLAAFLLVHPSAPAGGFDPGPDDAAIIEAGLKLAHELEASPMPLKIDPENGLVAAPGFGYRIHQGGFALAEGQLVINLGYTPLIFGQDLVLARGECALVGPEGLVKKELPGVSGPDRDPADPSIEESAARIRRQVLSGN